MFTRIGSRTGRIGIPPSHLIMLVIAVASAIVWSVRSMDATGQSEHPVTAIFLALGLSIGLPFLMLSTTSPLLQVWWARLRGGGIPYRLYAAVQLGFLAGTGPLSRTH